MEYGFQSSNYYITIKISVSVTAQSLHTGSIIVQWFVLINASSHSMSLSESESLVHLLCQERNHETCAVFFNLQKAFDSVLHQALLAKLHSLHGCQQQSP